MKTKQVVILISTVVPAEFVSSCRTGDRQIKTPSFTEHTIDDNARGTARLHACDLDNDGDVDILGAVFEENAMVYWRNEGGNPIVWTKLIVDDNFTRVWSVYALALDGDRDEDIIAGSGWKGINTVKWWENRSSH